MTFTRLLHDGDGECGNGAVSVEGPVFKVECVVAYLIFDERRFVRFLEENRVNVLPKEDLCGSRRDGFWSRRSRQSGGRGLEGLRTDHDGDTFWDLNRSRWRRGWMRRGDWGRRCVLWWRVGSSLREARMGREASRGRRRRLAGSR